MITLTDYFGRYAKHPDAGPGCWRNADELLGRVNELLEYAGVAGVPAEIDPDTGTEISGTSLAEGGGNGGFRPQDCPVGAPDSAHKRARAVDIYDPKNKLDDYLSEFDENDGRKNAFLEKFGLYREAPDKTLGWCHLTTRAPNSLRRTYIP